MSKFNFERKVTPEESEIGSRRMIRILKMDGIQLLVRKHFSIVQSTGGESSAKMLTLKNWWEQKYDKIRNRSDGL